MISFVEKNKNKNLAGKSRIQLHYRVRGSIWVFKAEDWLCTQGSPRAGLWEPCGVQIKPECKTSTLLTIPLSGQDTVATWGGIFTVCHLAAVNPLKLRAFFLKTRRKQACHIQFSIVSWLPLSLMSVSLL